MLEHQKKIRRMLDFYLIKDEVPKPGYPEEINLEYAGGLNFDTFEEMQSQKLIEARFDYWTDFRWNSQQVKQKADLLIRQYPDLRENRTKYERQEKILWTIIEKAIETNHGLIAYAD